MSENKHPLDQAMDLFVYAPLGFLFNLAEVMPELVAKGRNQVRLARTFGHYAVDKQAPQIVSKWQAELVRTIGLDRSRGRNGVSSTPAGNGSAPLAVRDGGAAARAAEPAPARSGPDAATLAIPDYDSLSASQVVPRLAGLTPAELEAVGAYEGAHRGRRTILNKVAQLQAG